MKENIEDADLWVALKNGQQSAFSQLYRRHVNVLYKYGQKITSDTQVIEDAIQDTFLHIWDAREKLIDPDSAKYYLLGILRNKIIYQLKKQNNTEELDESNSLHLLEVESHEHQIAGHEHEAANHKQVHRALTELPARQMEVINLRYFHELSHPEIAGLMNISLQSVHNTLQKAMKSLEVNIGPRIGLILTLYIFC